MAKPSLLAEANIDSQMDPAPQDEPDIPRQSGKRRHVRRRVASIVSWVILTVVVLLVLAVLVVPKLLGAVPLTVLTSSMEPTLPPGTLVVSQPVDPAKVGIGDVITYQPESGNAALITHRVVSASYGGAGTGTFVLQGDNSAAPDDPIIGAQIMGRVIYSVPLVGYLTSALPAGDRAGIITGLGVILVCYSAFLVISAIRTSRKKPSQRGEPR